MARQWGIFPIVALLAMSGVCLGDAIGYYMGRYAGKRMIVRYGAIFGAGPRELSWLEKQINNHGFWCIVGGNFHNILRAFVPYIAGSHAMPARKFWLANIVGALVWSVLILLLGVFFVENYQVILKYVYYIVFGIVAIVIAVYFLRKKKDLSLS